MAAAFAIAMILSELLFIESRLCITYPKIPMDAVFTMIIIKTMTVTFVDIVNPFFIPYDPFQFIYLRGVVFIIM